MKSAYTARQMHDADLYCEQKLNLPSLTLMSKAALALSKVCAKAITPSDRILFLCGKGNNAGDGFAAARLMTEMGYSVSVALLCGMKFSPDAAVMFRTVPEEIILETEEEILSAIDGTKLVVDCVYGTGFRGELPLEVKRIFDAVRGKRIIACDIPSGIGCDDGRVSDGALCASTTVTFAAYKPCFFLYPGKDFCGTVIPVDIGMPPQALAHQRPCIDLPDAEYIKSIMRHRPENSHKGTFGTLLTVCGSKDMTGAAVLSAQGALRCGVGLVTMALPRKVIPVIQARISEPVFTERKGTVKANAVLAGCGMGKDLKSLQFAFNQGKSMVLDADALNLIAEKPELLSDFLQTYPNAEVVVTPHPAEFARLLRTSVSRVESDRLGAVQKFLTAYPVTVVLKGHHTIVASREKTFINLNGNTGLSKGGSGDVLSGMIASFLAQGYPAQDAAVCGVYLHGAAADLLKESLSEHGMIPSDLPEAVARLLKKFETIA